MANRQDFTVAAAQRKLASDIQEGQDVNGVLILKDFLKEQGADLLGVGDNGDLQVRSQSGKEGVITPDNLLTLFKAQGIDTRGIALVTNTPDDPIQQSPLNAFERAQVKAFGNVKGSLDFLDKKFDGVSWDADKGFVVRKGRTFFALDPDGLGTGDAWDKTAELVKDTADLLDFGLDIALTSVGASTGATVGSGLGLLSGGPAGAAAGGLAGAAVGVGVGQAVSAGVRMSLGRLAGTYDDTPASQAADMAFEGVMAMGGFKYLPVVGKALQKGGKKIIEAAPTPTTIKNAYQNLNKKLSKTGKEIVSQYLRRTGNTAEEVHLHALNRPTQTFAIVEREVAKNPNLLSEQLVNKIAAKGDAPLNKMLSGVETFVRAGFRQRERDFIKLAPSKVETASVRDLVQQSMTEFMKVGAVVARKTSTAPRTSQELISSARGTLPKIEGLVAIRSNNFQPISVKELEGILVAQGISPLVAKPAHAQLRKLVGLANSIINTKSGSIRMSRVLEMRRQLDDFVFNVAKDPRTRKALSPATKPMREGFVKLLEGSTPAVRNLYRKMNDFWVKNQDLIEEADRVMSTPSSLNTFKSQIFGAAGKNTPQKALADRMVEMQGQRGKILINRFKDAQAAAHYVKSYPNMKGIIQPTLARILPGSTPRSQKALLKWVGRGAPMQNATAKETSAALTQTTQLRNALYGLSDEVLARLAKDEVMVKAFIGTATAGVATELKTQNQLTERAQQQ